MAGTDIDFNDPKVQRVLIILLVGIVVSGVLVWFQILPTSKEYAVKEKEHNEKRAQVTKIKNVVSELKSLKASVEKLEYECDSLRQMFLDKSDMSSLMNDLARIAAREGIKAANFKPEPEAIEREYYVEKKYKVVLIGGYHQIGSFLEELTKLDLILKVSDMKIEENKGLKTLLAKLKLKEYGALDKAVPSIQSTFYLTTFSYKK